MAVSEMPISAGCVALSVKLGIEPEHQHAAEYISNLLGFI